MRTHNRLANPKVFLGKTSTPWTCHYAQSQINGPGEAWALLWLSLGHGTEVIHQSDNDGMCCVASTDQGMTRSGSYHTTCCWSIQVLVV